MKRLGVGLWIVLAVIVIAVIILLSSSGKALTWDTNPADYEHGIAVQLDGDTWYFAGPGSDGTAVDIPGHTWKKTGETTLLGKHYNVGPPAASGQPWWSSDAPYGAHLYDVEAVIDTWSEEKAQSYAEDGFVHYHEFVNSEGVKHPTKVIWLKHIAVRDFTLDGGPAPDLSHAVYKRTVDNEFVPIGMNPYNPSAE